ncbi:MAG: NAD(P)H-dependent oxidoreductase [Actinobacteria bacterium]|nr:NAD(P)H-dependent oxidoreductase [Actinomycetota bacterium]
MKVGIVVGNPSPASRTRTVAQAVAAWICRHYGGEVVHDVDLADHARSMFDWPNDELDGLTADLAQCDVLVVASPTYKATYTGLFKAFFDRYGPDGLAGVVAVPVMTAGSPQHGLAIDVALRPLLVELGASVPTRGLCFLVPAQMPELEDVVERWATANLAPPALQSSR